MTAIEIVKKRTNMSDEDAQFYIEMANARVRSYLGLEESEDISKYYMSIADIAVLYWQKDQSILSSSSTLGYSSETFTEGAVSHQVTAMTGSLIYATYDDAITKVLTSLDYGAKEYEVVFL